MKLKDIFKKKEVRVDEFKRHKCKECGSQEFYSLYHITLLNNMPYCKTIFAMKCIVCNTTVDGAYETY